MTIETRPQRGAQAAPAIGALSIELDLPVDAIRADGAPGALFDDLDDAEKRIDATLADPRCSRPWAVAVLHQGDEGNLTRRGPAKGLPKLVIPNVSLIQAQGQPEA